jgi:N-acetylglucosaminyldiphosphoundecaprenol N-acetyl-beta-D-mannosaminyltransferase
MTSVAERSSCVRFACANPHSLVSAQDDPEFMSALRACEVTVADGIGVTMVARLIGVSVGPRITGMDFFTSMMARLNRHGGRVFFFGSSNAVLERMTVRAAREFPNVKIAVLSPPYGDWSESENDAMVQQIVDWQPDVLWVGMTAPKQEKWVQRNTARLNVPVIACVGAVFDYYAETVRRAPLWLCRLGMEWAYRLVQEPARLWRRTLVSAPQFVGMALRERLGLMLAADR